MIGERSRQHAAVTAEVEGDGEVAADVVEAASKPLGDLAEQEVVSVKACGRAVAVTPYGGAVEQVHCIAHHANMARTACSEKAPG